MFLPLSVLSQIRIHPITKVQETLAPLFGQSQSSTHSEQAKEPQQKLQHRNISLANYFVKPEPKQLKRCNDVLRSHLLNDNLNNIPGVFQALDQTFFNGRVGKVATAVGIWSTTPYIAGIGDYSFLEANGVVIRLPKWDGKTSTLLDDVNILFREIAYIDFYMLNTCRCEDCRGSNSGKAEEFIEYLTRLDKLVNLNLETFPKEWKVREDNDFDVLKMTLEKANEAKKVEEDAVAVDYARCVEQLEEVTLTAEAMNALMIEQRDRADCYERLYVGVLESTKIVDPPRRRNSLPCNALKFACSR